MKDVDQMHARLERLGLRFVENGDGHYKIMRGRRRVAGLSKTPSDHRWQQNLLAELKRNGCDIHQLERRPKQRRRISQAPEQDFNTLSPFTPPPLLTKEDMMKQLTLESLRSAVADKDYFAAGDISLGVVPLQPRGRRQDPATARALAEMCSIGGASAVQLRSYRYVASRFAPESRRADVAWHIHHTLAPHPRRFEIIAGRDKWTSSDAAKASREGRRIKPRHLAGKVMVSNLRETTPEGDHFDSGQLDADASRATAPGLSDGRPFLGIVTVDEADRCVVATATGRNDEALLSALDEVNTRVAEISAAISRLYFELGQQRRAA